MIYMKNDSVCYNDVQARHTARQSKLRPYSSMQRQACKKTEGSNPLAGASKGERATAERRKGNSRRQRLTSHSSLGQPPLSRDAQLSHSSNTILKQALLECRV